jgi:glycosyltransferase involved in cell wall biosynthesis
MSANRSILYVNQTSQVSGAERSLLDLLGGLPETITATVACPVGQLTDAVEAAGFRVVPIPGTDVSFRLHPLHTTRGLFWIVDAGRRLKRIAEETGADLIHANTTRAGLAATVASRLGAPPSIVHIRDWLPQGWVPTATIRVIESGSLALIANSEFIASEMPPRTKRAVRVIHNPIDVSRFDPDALDRGAARAAVGIGEDDLALAMVAQLTPWKGQDDAVRILGHLANAHPHLRLLIAGSAKFTASGARFDNLAFERELHSLADQLGVSNRVLFLGERDDVPRILRAADILLAPSWKEAFGRIAVEGMAMRLPVVAAGVGGLAEIVRDGVDGRLLAPRQARAWSETVDELLRNPELRRSFGESGRARALSEFSVRKHVDSVLAVYGEVLERP